MEKAEIKRIAEYLKDLKEGLYEWDYPLSPKSWQFERVASSFLFQKE